MVFARKTAAPTTEVISEKSLDQALNYLATTSGTWFDGTEESVSQRLATVNRVRQINAHLLETSSDITRFSFIEDSLESASEALNDILLAANAKEDVELPSFAVHAASVEHRR